MKLAGALPPKPGRSSTVRRTTLFEISPGQSGFWLRQAIYASHTAAEEQRFGAVSGASGAWRAHVAGSAARRTGAGRRGDDYRKPDREQADDARAEAVGHHEVARWRAYRAAAAALEWTSSFS